MKKIDISFTLSPEYKNQFVAIQKTEFSLSFELQNGKHRIETTPIDIGRLMYFNNSVLQAQLSFSYEFDAEHKILTVGGTGYATKDSMHLTTFPKGTVEYCHQDYLHCTIDDEGSKYNANWNYTTQMTPNLEELFIAIIKNANDTLIETIKQQEGLTIRVKTDPPKLSPEDYSNMLTVYKENKFVSMYDPNTDYGDSYSIISIESIWGGIVTFTYGENFANVIGSTPDPHIAGKSWIRLWEDQYGIATTCTSLNYNNFVCNVSSGLVGGHIILGTVAKVMPAGSDVYIMPICTAHNNNDNVYMAALQYLGGIWLKNYLN